MQLQPLSDQDVENQHSTERGGEYWKRPVFCSESGLADGDMIHSS